MNHMKQKMTACFGVLALAIGMVGCASLATPANAPQTIDLPHYVLHFTLPDEMADAIPPWKLVPKFDPADSNYLRVGSLAVATGLHEFKGPFWIGTRGYLGFNFTVQRRSREYGGEINTLDGLERYLRWWMRSGSDVEDFSFDRSILAVKCVRRWRDTFGGPANSAGEREELEIFSVPLDGEEFLDIGFHITESIPGSTAEWKQRAEELRDAIKATIVLEPKSTGNQ